VQFIGNMPPMLGIHPVSTADVSADLHRCTGISRVSCTVQ
jgi:hypothetical protein